MRFEFLVSPTDSPRREPWPAPRIVRRIAGPGLARPRRRIEGLPQGPRRFSWIRCQKDGAGDCHSGSAGIHDRACILRIDPALREYRETASSRGRQGREAERRPARSLRKRRKNRRELHIACGGLARRERLGRCVAGSPDPGIPAEKLTRLEGTHPIETEVDAIDPLLGRGVRPRPQGERYIAAPIDNDAHPGARFAAGRSSVPCRPGNALRKLEEGFSGEVLLADLHPIHAARDRFGNHLLEGTADQGAIRHETKDGP